MLFVKKSLSSAADCSTHFLNIADANDIILQMRIWEHHNVRATPGFGGDIQKALRSIKVPLLYMPSETDLYFPVGDARYEAAFIPGVTLTPVSSLWGHAAGAASNPADSNMNQDSIFYYGSPGGRSGERVRKHRWKPLGRISLFY